MTKETKYFLVKCNKCKTEVKVSPEVYRKKEKVECDQCQQAMFKKFKLS
jgi:PHP family Zn ribbon phosphoesterase